VIFYFPLSDGIDVVRVLDGRQDVEGTFSAEWPEGAKKAPQRP